MEKCELDRLKAIKAVFLDFSAAISNVIPGIHSTVDKMLLYQETIQPLSDLRFIVESYCTGQFAPKVFTFENYYNLASEQTFGVDLELRSRQDKKRVPNIVSTILSYMDDRYPEIADDKTRQNIWTQEVPLSAIHHLRQGINTGEPIQKEKLQFYETPIVANALKLFLLELPDSLIPSSIYDIIKTIYQTHGTDEDARTRIFALQNTLSQLKVTNIATLDAICTHFCRLITITSADSMYITELSASISLCILRPRLETSLTQHDRHGFRLVQDLLNYKDRIFSDLKRGTTSTAHRRAVSTQENKRRADVESTVFAACNEMQQKNNDKLLCDEKKNNYSKENQIFQNSVDVEDAMIYDTSHEPQLFSKESGQSQVPRKEDCTPEIVNCFENSAGSSYETDVNNNALSDNRPAGQRRGAALTRYHKKDLKEQTNLQTESKDID